MKLSKILAPAILIAGFGYAGSSFAGNINVTTTTDEDMDVGGAGCSLREAMQAHFNNNGADYRGCTGGTAGDNTITLQPGSTYTVNASVGAGILPNVTASGGQGALTITGGGIVTCAAPPNSTRLFTVVGGGTLNFLGISVQDCSADGSGIGVNITNGNFTATGASFTNLHSINGGTGGAIRLQGGGTMALTGVNFTANGVRNDADPLADPTATDGSSGGAIGISGLTDTQFVTITGGTFQANTARNNGGAIWYRNPNSGTYAVKISGATFTGNVAGGGDAQDGGGAIWALPSGGGTSQPFSIQDAVFTQNHALQGVGGAIAIPLSGLPGIAFPGTGTTAELILGGVYGCHFFQNDATGPAGNGAGGAIYTRGLLTVAESSFFQNTSGFDNGGAIAFGNNNNAVANTIVNSTFNSNGAALQGGAVFVDSGSSSVQLINTTIAGNGSAGNGGGAIARASGTVTVTNSLLGDSTSSGTPQNCVGTITDGGNNLQFQSPAGDTSCGGTIPEANPLLQNAGVSSTPGLHPLVFVMELNELSPASGAGNAATCAAPPVNNADNTGRLGIRPNGFGPPPANTPTCDIGAYESASTTPVTLQSFSVE